MSPAGLVEHDGLVALLERGGTVSHCPDDRARVSLISIGDAPLHLTTSVAPSGLSALVPMSSGWVLAGDEVWGVVASTNPTFDQRAILTEPRSRSWDDEVVPTAGSPVA